MFRIRTFRFDEAPIGCPMFGCIVVRRCVAQLHKQRAGTKSDVLELGTRGKVEVGCDTCTSVLLYIL